MHYKPRARLVLSVLKFGATADSNDDPVVFEPAVIDCHWERNHHLMADTVSASIPWRQGGIDPRQLKNARCQFYLWDDNYAEFNERKHLRFTGICKSAKRSMSAEAQHVELKFHDYTDMFIGMKPYPSDGIPEYTDDLETAWKKICDNTGWWDDEGKKINSSVKQLRDSILIDPRVPQGPIGKAVTSRFHAVAKPQPPANASAWEVWMYICSMMGVISYIDKDTCVVTTDAALYDPEQAPSFLQGQNIFSLEEEADTAISGKAILLKSFDPLRGVQLESIYPPPGDVRVKLPRGAAKRALKGGAPVNANDVSKDLEEFFCYEITDQAALDAKAHEVYNVRNRQELSGSFKTMEMRVTGADGAEVDVLTLSAGNPIKVGVDLDIAEVASIQSGVADQIAYLTDRLGYDEGLARLIVSNITVDEIQHPLYHVKSLDVQLGPDKFEIEIKYHNVIEVPGAPKAE